MFDFIRLCKQGGTGSAKKRFSGYVYPYKHTYRAGPYSILILLLLVHTIPVRAQNQPAPTSEQLLKQLESAKQDTNKVNLLDKIVDFFKGKDPQKTLLYASQELELAKTIGWEKGQAMAYYALGRANSSLNEEQKALELYQLGYELAKKNKLIYLQYQLLDRIGFETALLGNYDLGIPQMKSAIEYFQSIDVSKKLIPEWYISAMHVGRFYRQQHKDTAALNYYQQILRKYIREKDTSRIHTVFSLLVLFCSYNDEGKALQYSFQELTYFSPGDTTNTHTSVMLSIARSFVRIKNYVKGLEYYQAALALNPTGDISTRRVAKSGMRDVYMIFEDFKKALSLDLEILVEVQKNPSDSWNSSIYSNYSNLAEDYIKLKQYNEALLYLNKALETSPEFFHTTISLMFIDVYYQTHRYDEALRTVKEVMNTKGVNNYHKSQSLRYAGMIIRDAPDDVLQKDSIPPAERYQQAIKNLQLALDYFKRTKRLDDMQECYKELSITYDLVKDYKGFYDTYKPYIGLRDSSVDRDNQNTFLNRVAQIEHEKKEDSLRYQQRLTEERLRQQTLLFTQQRQAFQLNQQQLDLLGKEKDLQQLGFLKTQADLQAEQSRRKANEKQLSLSQKEQALAQTTVQLQKAEIKGKQAQSRYLLAGIAVLFVLSFFIARNYVNQRRSNKVISAEKKRSDNLLLNILPADVAEELKEKGTADARLFDHVTVLFTDFVNFTTIGELLTPQELVDELHHCFKAFDEIIGKYRIEKIKTIGDAYLAVAGLPHADPAHAANTIRAALEIRQFIHLRKKQMGSKSFDIRIGIHSGSVVAGIVGVKKFAYDIWGDTVNTAARMEQHSMPGQINLSEKTYELVKDQFAFSYRGEIEAKNKGMLKMYFVEKQSAPMPVIG